MPKIDVSYKDLCMLVGKKIQLDQLREDLLYAKSELDDVDGDTLKIDIKDTNRPDLWSAEGIAREIAGRYGKRGLPRFRLKKGGCKVIVDTRSPVQPMAVSAVARNLKIDDAFLSQIIQLQEKLSLAFGRNRKNMSMGVYDLEKIKFPVKYTSLNRKKIHFAPLGFENPMPADEIIRQHQKGKAFGHLLAGTDEYPVWADATGKILSMPPIINSNDIGNVSTKTKNVFIECTGYSMRFLHTAIAVLAAQMLDRGGAVETVSTYFKGKKIITPSMAPKKTSVDTWYANKISGLDLGTKDIVRLLEMARYDCKGSKKRIDLLYPSYRHDIMHMRDIVEDIIISYGYNKIDCPVKKIHTVGKADNMQLFIGRVQEICVGLGLQEIMSYTLTNQADLFGKMMLAERKAVEIENPVSQNWSVFRTWLVPQLLGFFSQNMHIEYPQQIFEIGTVVHINEPEETKTDDRTFLSIGYTASIVNYDLISSYLDAIMRNLGVKYSLEKTVHGSFIKGRCAAVVADKNKIGTIGEISPAVLSNWKLEKPVLSLEIDLSQMFELGK
ncbi:MAG: phenylalanine--tRNA ligase subunit beta [Candidatus Aenigmarchaeota archaeon]|nr:phenylalanine--tRNA ligase subunit beta [Candidatus Aenigmarchaeota archaeon]